MIGNLSGKLRYFFLILILIAAFIIRYKGTWFGYPLMVHPDEPNLVKTALRIIQTGNLNPHFFLYPTLNIYLLGMLYSGLNFTNQLFFNISTTNIPEIQYFISGRIFVLLQSTVTIYVTYQIGRRLFDSIAGLASACFIGASFLHISNSFTVTVDSSVALWASLSTLMAVLIYTNGKKRWYYLLGGVFVALTTSSKYTGFVSVAPILIAHMSLSRVDRTWVDTNIILYLLVIPVAFFLTMPYAILDYKAFLEALKFQAHVYKSGHLGHESMGNTSFHLYGKYLLTKGYGVAPSIFAGFGILWLLKKDVWKVLILISTPLLLFIFVGLYKVYFSRNIVAIIPFVSLFSGIFVCVAYNWLKDRVSEFGKSQWMKTPVNILFVILVISSITPQVIRAGQYIRKITLPDTRWVSMQWIKDHLPEGSWIGRGHYTPPIEKHSKKFLVRYLGYNAVLSRSEEVKRFDYMIVSSGSYQRFLDSPQRYSKQANTYRSFFAQNELVHEFIPDDKFLGGPKISIYKITKRRREYQVKFIDETGNVIVGLFTKALRWGKDRKGRVIVLQWDEKATFLFRDKKGKAHRIPNDVVKNRILDLSPSLSGKLKGDIRDIIS